MLKTFTFIWPLCQFGLTSQMFIFEDFSSLFSSLLDALELEPSSNSRFLVLRISIDVTHPLGRNGDTFKD